MAINYYEENKHTTNITQIGAILTSPNWNVVDVL